MSRAASGDTVVIKPSNNVYTALVVIATVVVILGLIVLFTRANAIFGTGLLN